MANDLTSFDAGRATPIDQTQATYTTKPRARLNAQGQWEVFGGGSSDWFGPGNPIPALAPPDQQIRSFDYPVALNQAYSNKRSPGTLPYSQLYYFATYYDLARILIERRKNQIAKLEWNIQPRDQKAKRDKRCDEIETFFRRPDGENFWQQWIKKLLNDVIVYDAGFVYPMRDQRGRLLSLEVPDGTTFKFLIDERGMTPRPPWPAYQQIIKGVPAWDFTRDELFFMPFNPTNDRIGGYSVIEQIVVTITMALSNQASQLSYFTNGATPDMILSVPEGWAPAQVKEFKQWWDSLLEGNLQKRRGTMFVYNGMNPINTKEAVIKTPLDEWIARIMCFAFGESPAPFVANMNRATAENLSEQSKENGVGAQMDWVRSLMDYIIDECFGYDDLCFRWREEDETDPLTKAQCNEIKLRNGVLSINEWREDEARDPDPDGNDLMIYTASGPVLLSEAVKPPEPPPQLAGPIDPSKKPAPGQGTSETTPADVPGAGNSEEAKKVAGASTGGDPFVGKRREARALNPSKADVAALAGQIQPVLAKLGRTIAARLAHRLGKASGSDVDSWLADLDYSDLVALTEILDSGITAQMEGGFTDAVVEVGGAIDNMLAIGLPNQRAVQYADERAAALIGANGAGGELADATREMLRGTIRDALDSAQTVDELQASLEDDYAFSADRAETIARTELKSAMSAGNAEGWRASGVVTGKVWQVSNDDVCDICLDNEDAGEIALDDVFPSGDDMPGAHPNCNCTVYPVVEGDDSED